MVEERYADFDTEESIDVKEFLTKCFHYWYYFAIVLVVALLIATLINRFTVPEYKVTTYLLVRDEENPLDPQNFIGTSLYGNPYKLQNEIGLLQSKSLTRKTLLELNFYVSYFLEDKFTSTDLYNASPFLVLIDSLYDQPLGVSFKINFINDTSMVIDATAKEASLYNYKSKSITGEINDFEFNDTVAFGDLCGNQFCRFRILPKFENLKQTAGDKIFSFHFNSLSGLVNLYRISEIEATKNSSILQMSVRCRNVQQGVDYLNKLTEVFLNKGIERDDKIALSTINFIDDQLKGISDSLRFSEDMLEKFRTSRGVTNIDYQAQQTYEQMENLQDQQAELIVKSKYYNYLKDYLLKNNEVSDLIAPSSMDISDPLLNSLIIELTGLYGERTESSFNTIKDNPYLRSLESKIADIKAKLIENIDNIIKSSDISLKEIENRIGSIETTINKLPQSQREYFKIDRIFKLNDAIYTYLLTKRAEVQISKASNIPSNEILDNASADDFQQVSPGTKMNYIIALIMGLFIPGAFIYLRDYFRNKIGSKHELQGITKIPVIGQIIHNTFKTGSIVNEMPTSVIAESFRSLRTNFQFFSNANDKNVILVTSTIKGEGKSFTSVNLGTVFAQGKKKVVIIDFDLRKAKIKQYLDIESGDEGLSKYLSGHSNINDILFSSGIDDLSVIPSGPIPPNPLELISSEKTVTLFEELKRKFDVIIIDSPPIALVSDGLLLLKFANIKLIVVRQNYTPRDLFISVLHDLEKREITSLNIILNDEKGGLSGYGYGYSYNYGYGYGHDKNKRSLKEKIKGIFRS